MKNYLFIISVALLVVAFVGCQTNNKKVKKTQSIKVNNSYVDPFIGTSGHGHTYPGATVPFGMIQVSPDNGFEAWDWCSGYHYSDSIIAGFSHLHLSGTGIGDLNDILFMPANKSVVLPVKFKTREDLPYVSKFSHDTEESATGYYKVFLEDPKVLVELTAGKRVAFHRYTYNKDSEQSVVIDLGFSINWDAPTDCKLTVEDEYTVSGYRFSTGWAKNQKVFFVAKFSKPIVKQLFSANGKITDVKTLNAKELSSQLFFDSKNGSVLNAKVAVSSVSVDNAKDNLSRNKMDFNAARTNAYDLWTKDLAKIQVETDDESLKTVFYTSLYHCQIAPVTFSDANGDSRLQNDSIINTKDKVMYSTLSLWDTFRAENPLLTLLYKKMSGDIINTMLEYYNVNKRLPVWNLYGNENNCMTGYHSIPVIVEAYLKGVKGFDAEKAYEDMKQTMMQDERGLKFYKKYGYLPTDKDVESVTKTLEYSYDDYCVAQMAKALGKTEDYDFFMKRSMSYKNVFDPKTKFMRGKKSDGKSWSTPFDPKHSNHRENTDYTEGNAWQHSWFVLHDVQGLIKLHGGNKPFTEKLEQLFTESSEITGDNVSVDISGLIGQYAHGNEPSHHIAYMFNFANKPWRTQYWVHKILESQYNTTTNGLCGNEDCGQMSAWYVFSSLGFYPYSPVSNVYQIGTPLFKKSEISLPNGKVFTIEANNVSNNNFYIQSATLNGKHYNKSYITYEDITNGGVLKFEMGNKPNEKWGLEK